MFTDVIILAGGSGERLWPASIPSCPKQFMSIKREVTFLQSTLLRSFALKTAGNILIITRRDIAALVIDNCISLLKQLDKEEQAFLKEKVIIIAEPCARNTAPALVLGCAWIQSQNRKEKPSVVVLTSDHKITPVEFFVQDIEKAASLAESTSIVCFCIPPAEPSTGFGYIKTGISCSDKISNAWTVEEFREKPDSETAKAYIAAGNYYWNSGMYGFFCESFIKELTACAPAVAKAFSSLMQPQIKVPHIARKKGIQIIDKWQEMENAYSQTPSLSIDYAVAEKTHSICAVKADFLWDDVGSWDAFSRLCEEEQGKLAETESSNCFVYSDIPVALCGVKDLVVVIKNGKALVLKKGQSHLIKDVLRKMKGTPS